MCANRSLMVRGTLSGERNWCETADTESDSSRGKCNSRCTPRYMSYAPASTSSNKTSNPKARRTLSLLQARMSKMFLTMGPTLE